MARALRLRSAAGALSKVNSPEEKDVQQQRIRARLKREQTFPLPCLHGRKKASKNEPQPDGLGDLSII